APIISSELLSFMESDTSSWITRKRGRSFGVFMADESLLSWARTSGMFKFLGHFTTAHPRAICATRVVAGATLTLPAPPRYSRCLDDDIHFLPDRCPSVRGYQLLEQAFPRDVFASRAIFALERADKPLTQADLGLIDQCVADLNRLRQE